MLPIDSTNDNIKTCKSQEPQPTMKTSQRRCVRFQCDNNVVHETEPMSSEELQAYFMQRQDYQWCDNEIKESVKKWMLSQAGRIVFDEEQFSVRGVESILDYMKCMHCPMKQSRYQQTTLHIHKVLKAFKQQPNDVKQIRIISQRYSAAALDLARRTAERDASVVRTIMAQPNPSTTTSSFGSKQAVIGQECAPMHKDKKARLGHRFSFLRRAARNE